MAYYEGTRSIHVGSLGRIVGAIRKDGSCPSEDFLRGLESLGQAQFKTRFERLTTLGHLRSPEHYRPLQVPGTPRVWEIKISAGKGLRLYVVPHHMTLADDRLWVATHGAPKPKDKQVPAQVHLARTIYDEWTDGRLVSK